MYLIASDFYTYHRPSKCALRVYLRHREITEGPLSPYDEVIRRLGQRHEETHLATFASVVNLRGGTREERMKRTREEVGRGAPVIYQAVLHARTELSGVECDVAGDPDFLINKEGRYVIRDSKVSKRITEKAHPEIFRQLQIYGWLYEKTFGHSPLRLEVHSGPGDLVEIPYDGGITALALLQEILSLKQDRAEPFSPVGWSNCGNCGFHDRCWPIAEKNRDVALVPGVDQGLAIALRQEGITTMDDFVARFDAITLAEYKRPRGGKSVRVGKDAASILQMARALVSGKETIIQPPDVPNHPNYVMFDLEGLPPQLDELEKIYLWGLQIYGERPSSYKAAKAGFGVDGDRQGWETFLAEANAIFEEYGDLPFVHWHIYERTKLEMYIERFGDRDGIAARVHHNLLDLHPRTESSIALPLPSYSLKVIEQYVGFKRTQDEYGGNWAMAKYIEATETEDDELRRKVMDQILLYNQEDLAATWAVFQWLRSKCAA